MARFSRKHLQRPKVYLAIKIIYSMVNCVVLKCPECGKERPYPTERARIEEGIPRIRLEQGITLHYKLFHPNLEPPMDIIIQNQKIIDVDKDLVDKVENAENWRKWDYYNLL